MRRGRLLGISLLMLLLVGAGGVAAWRARHATTTGAAASAGHPAGPSAAAGASPAGAATREAAIEASLSAITDGDGAAAQTSEFAALLRRKIDAIKRVWKLEEQFSLARLQAQQLEQVSAGAGGPPPEIPSIVGIGAMSAP